MNKKGQILSSLGGTFQQLAFLGIFGAIMLVILAELKPSLLIGNAGQNNITEGAVNHTITGIGNVFEQFPLFGTILGLLLIVGVVFLLVRGSSKSGIV